MKPHCRQRGTYIHITALSCKEKKKPELFKGRQRLVHFQSLHSGLTTGSTQTGDQHGLIISACLKLSQ